MTRNAKFGAALMALLTLIYTGLLANTAITLLLLEEPLAKFMGALILIFPILAIWVTIREFIFGTQIEKLANKIEREGKWPHFDFELRPSGRPTRESADRVFAAFAKGAEEHPEDFMAWFSLGLAYDAAGDRKRARASMRKALKLFAAN
jgi:hypothetical protein